MITKPPWLIFSLARSSNRPVPARFVSFVNWLPKESLPGTRFLFLSKRNRNSRRSFSIFCWNDRNSCRSFLSFFIVLEHDKYATRRRTLVTSCDKCKSEDTFFFWRMCVKDHRSGDWSPSPFATCCRTFFRHFIELWISGTREDPTCRCLIQSLIKESRAVSYEGL